jgi:23S rRNA (guanosine2251-2'-O)-methyltransferase
MARKPPPRSARPSSGPQSGARKPARPGAASQAGGGKPAASAGSANQPGTLLWGLHPVRQAWANGGRHIRRVLVTHGGQEALGTPESPAGVARPALELVERDVLDRMTPRDAVHQGVVALVDPLEEVDIADIAIQAETVPDMIVLVLDQVTDPHNVGAILRSAAAFGAAAVILPRRNAPEETGVLAKSASGALEVVPLVHVTNLARALDQLGEAGFFRVGMDEGGVGLGEGVNLCGRLALVLGAEGSGLRRLTRELCDVIVQIPTVPPISSLNVSNAAAVALFEARRQRLGAS